MNRYSFLATLGASLLLHGLSFAQGEEHPVPNAVARLEAAEMALPEATQERIRIVLATNSIRCGLLDQHGHLWFGSNRGAHRFDGEEFLTFGKDDGLPREDVYAMLEDKDGILWFGTGHGLIRYDHKEFTHIPLPWSEINGQWIAKLYPLMNPNGVASLAQSKDGSLGVGTFGAGAYRYDGQTFTSFLAEIGKEYDDGLQHNWIPSIREAENGDLWFASMSWAGATRYDGETFTEFQVEDGLSDPMVRVVFPDREGGLWFGSNGNREGGLDHFDGKEFTNFDASNGHAHPIALAMHRDRSGDLWIACERFGVCIYDGKNFRSFSEEQGLDLSRIHFFTEDSKGSLWFGGGSGQLYRFDGETLADYANRLPK